MPVIQVGIPKRTLDSGSSVVTFEFSNPTTAGSTLLLLVANYSSEVPTSVATVAGTPQAFTLDNSYPSSINRVFHYRRDSVAAGVTQVNLTPSSSVDNYLSGVLVEVSEVLSFNDSNGATASGTVLVSGYDFSGNNRNYFFAATAANFGSSDCNFALDSPAIQLDVEQSSDTTTGYICGYFKDFGAVADLTTTSDGSMNSLGTSYTYAASGPTEYTITPSGGVVFSGEPNVTREKVFSVSGGVSFGGTADAVLNKNYIISPSGGIVFGGAPNVLRERAIVPSGGIVFSGAAAFGYERILSPSGGAIFGGTGNITFEPTSGTTYTITPSGGVAFSGASDVLRERTIAPNGGITFGGSSSLQRERSIIPSGGIVFDGTAPIQGDHIIIPNGGIVFGGNGGMFFVPAGGGSGLIDAQRLNVKVSKAMGL